MFKDNLLLKKLKKQFIYINDLLESNFNKLKILKSNIRKTKFTKNNRPFLAIATTVILTLSYFLIPTFFSKDLMKSLIKNEILKKYNIDIKFNEKLKYGLLPKPHFVSEKISIIKDKRVIAITDNFKVFVAANNFFSINKIKVKNLIFSDTDFNIYKEDFNFFTELLKTEPNQHQIIFKNSNIFYKNSEDEILFINKINKSKFYYDQKNLRNTLVSTNKIFNVPFKLNIKNDKFNKKISTNFVSKKIRLSAENEIDYSASIKKGLLDILLINNNTSLEYKIKKNSLQFQSKDTKNLYNGTIDFKPFYLNASFNYDGLSSKNIFNHDSILYDLIKSEIFNNDNLNIDLELNVKDITNIDELNDLVLKISIDGGNIIVSGSNIMWKDDLKITLDDSFIVYEKDDLYLLGKVSVDVKDIKNFYSSFQIKKNYRKKFKKIEFDFNFNFYRRDITFDNFKIDDASNTNIEKYFSDFNLKKNRIFNKITFKNFVSDFFKAYSG